MENQLKATIWLLALLTTGLSAGLFYGWTVSVIPGTKLITDRSYLETMQSINRAILNPWFFFIFFGPVLLITADTYLQFREDISLTFWLTLIAMLAYLIGTIGVTAFGNVPMNETLYAIQLHKLDTDSMKALRQLYEGRWNQFNTIRTVCAILAFAALLSARIANQVTITNN